MVMIGSREQRLDKPTGDGRGKYLRACFLCAAGEVLDTCPREGSMSAGAECQVNITDDYNTTQGKIYRGVEDF